MFDSDTLKKKVLEAGAKYGFSSFRLIMLNSGVGFSTASFLLKGEYKPEIKATLAEKLLTALEAAQNNLKSRAS